MNLISYSFVNGINACSPGGISFWSRRANSLFGVLVKTAKRQVGNEAQF